MSKKLLSVAAFAAAALAAPGAAQAATAAGGQTDLSLAPAAAKALTSAGVKVAPVGTRAAADGSIPFPVTGLKGSGAKLRAIDHSGGLKLSRNGRSLTLKNFRIVVRKGAPKSISATVGKLKNVPVFRLSNAKTKVAADGLDTKISGVRVHVGPLASVAIRGTLGVKLPTGYPLATANVTLQAAATRVTLDPGTAQALTGLGVSVAPEAPAVAGSSIQFPITNKGGRIALDQPITHSGGLVFSAGTTSLTVGDFTIDPKAGILYAERTPVGRLALLKVDLSGISTSTPGVQVRVDGAKLSLTADAAGALNSTFNTTALAENLPIGTAQIVGLK